MGNFIAALAAGSFLMILIWLFVSIAIQALVLYIGTLICQLPYKGQFVWKYLGKVILYGMAGSLLANVFNILVVMLVPSVVSLITIAIVRGVAAFLVHYYGTFAKEDRNIKTKLPIMYAVIDFAMSFI